MNLYLVHLWDDGLKEETHVFMPAASEEEAEEKALENSYLGCAEAIKVTEIDGYRPKFEKIG